MEDPFFVVVLVGGYVGRENIVVGTVDRFLPVFVLVLLLLLELEY